MKSHKIFLLAISSLLISPVHGKTMKEFVFSEAQKVGVSGEWLWRICKHESKTYFNGKPQPWPYTLHFKGSGLYYSGFKAAKHKLDEIFSEHGSMPNVDIGMCQVNWYWHNSKVNGPADLLDYRTNVKIAAEILKEGMAARGTWEGAAAYYHAPNDIRRGEWYVSRL